LRSIAFCALKYNATRGQKHWKSTQYYISTLLRRMILKWRQTVELKVRFRKELEKQDKKTFLE
jgi:hypothetical protein